MANAVQSTYAAEQALGAKVTDIGSHGAVKMGLFTSPSAAITPTNLDNGLGSGAGQVTEATSAALTGYARQTVTFGSVTSPSAGVAQVLGNTVSFVITAVPTPTTLYGWFMLDGAAALRFAQDFAAAISITVPGTLTVGPGNTITWQDATV